MTKRIIKGVAAAALAVAACVGVYSQNQHREFNMFEVSQVEATAGCETSSNPNKNIFKCTKLANSNTEVCVENGADESTECSGNY